MAHEAVPEQSTSTIPKKDFCFYTKFHWLCIIEEGKQMHQNKSSVHLTFVFCR